MFILPSLLSIEWRDLARNRTHLHSHNQPIDSLLLFTFQRKRVNSRHHSHSLARPLQLWSAITGVRRGEDAIVPSEQHNETLF